MELLTGIPLLCQQYRALFKKNVLLSMRNKRSIILRILSPIFFLFVLILTSIGLEQQERSLPGALDLKDPETLVSPPIPPCEEKFYVRNPCFDFVWSGNESARVQSLVSNIMASNPGRPIPPSKVKSFRTPKDLDEWLFDNQMHCSGALHFEDRNATMISFGVQTNMSANLKRNIPQNYYLEYQITLQLAAERGIARALLGDSSFSWALGLTKYPHPASFKVSDKKNAAISLLGIPLFLAIAMFSFIFQISSVVLEKELNLRQAMNVMGLYDTAYWLSWLMWEGIILLIQSIVTILVGMTFQFEFFLRNNFVVLFLVFFLFQLSMMGLAFMLSTLLSKSSSSTTVGFALFIIFSISATIVGHVGYSAIPKKYRILYVIFPPHPFGGSVKMLIDASSNKGPGIGLNKLQECPDSSPGCVPLTKAFLWQVSTFFLWFVLALYADNVIPNSAGVRKSLIYFLSPSYWTGNDGEKMEEGCLAMPNPALDHITSDDVDVRDEESTVKQEAKEGTVDPNVAVQIRGLMKRYPAMINCSCTTCCHCCCCCTVKISKPYQAVKGLWMNFAKDQLFCLLGPNGAGKTTTISCLTGITPVTMGDALIYGQSIRTSIGMSNVRKIIGVCPQFDILWNTLTGEEHLWLFACMKGLNPSEIDSVAHKLLDEVKLSESAKVRAGSYSGGMKRRLSVAAALIGDPKLVILDEPTTGMDPITRRHVWDVIERAKKGRAILLTTHSMEEADILSDRIGIMAKGRLRCIGTSIRLKSRFGSGFIANLRLSEGFNSEGVKSIFKQRLDLVPKEEHRYTLSFVIPTSKEDMLKDFFAELQRREREFGIEDIQLSLTTLEEVFLNIAKAAELETAAAEGNMETLTLTNGTQIKIPVGARFVGIPGTESSENPRGVMVKVNWTKDENGAIVIAGHSPETPVPANAQVKASAPIPTSATLGHENSVHGIVYDLD